MFTTITKAICATVATTAVAATVYASVRHIVDNSAAALRAKETKEERESSKWDTRLMQAMENITAGLEFDKGEKDDTGRTPKQTVALKLRARAQQYCREREAINMTNLEDEIQRFQLRGQ
jgi:hypothetical protein